MDMNVVKFVVFERKLLPQAKAQRRYQHVICLKRHANKVDAQVAVHPLYSVRDRLVNHHERNLDVHEIVANLQDAISGNVNILISLRLLGGVRRCNQAIALQHQLPNLQANSKRGQHCHVEAIEGSLHRYLDQDSALGYRL